MSDMFAHVTLLGRCLICTLIFIFIVTPGCAWRLPAGGQPPKDVSASAVHDGRLVAVAQINLATSRGNYPLRAAIIVQRPAWLRLELLPFIGPPDLYLTASPERMSVYLPAQAEFYIGEPTAANMARFLPWAVSVEEMVAILWGTCFAPEKGYVSCRYFGEENPAAGAPTGMLKTMIRYDEDNKKIYHVSFDDYQAQAACPGRIVFDLADGSVRVTMRYTDLKVEKQADKSVFEIDAPGDARIIDLDCS